MKVGRRGPLRDHHGGSGCEEDTKEEGLHGRGVGADRRKTRYLRTLCEATKEARREATTPQASMTQHEQRNTTRFCKLADHPGPQVRDKKTRSAAFSRNHGLLLPRQRLSNVQGVTPNATVGRESVREYQA